MIDINLRSAIIQSVDYNLVLISNSKIVDSPFKNFGRIPRGRVILSCGIGYESDLSKVQEITENAIKAKFEQRPEENIEFFYAEFGSSSINYMIRLRTDVTNQSDVYKAQHAAILTIRKAYNEQNINIPFPTRTLDFGKNKFRSETLDIRDTRD